MVRALELADYRELVDLDERYEVARRDGWAEAVPAVLAAIDSSTPPPDDIDQAVALLRARLAPLEPRVLADERIIDNIEAIAVGHRAHTDQVVVDPLSLPPVPWVANDRVSVWVGDITVLAADAIVNAANSTLLGCRLPNHPCIDNAIHSGAGPRLRDDCAAIIAAQGNPEPVGEAKITRGYALPARYVLHTVGPQLVPGTAPTPAERAQLASCYTRCLDTAAELDDIGTVAFCAISTGVFAYPKADAARVAITTVAAWMDRNPDRLDRVVFNLFSPDDAAVYRDALSTWS